MITISPPLGSIAAPARQAESMRRLLLALAIYLVAVVAYLAAAQWSAQHHAFPATPPPYPGQQSAGSVEATIFTGGKVDFVPKPSRMLGGWLLHVQGMPPQPLKNIVGGLLGASVLLALLLGYLRVREPWRGLPILLLLSAASILCSLRLSIGMDEFFINLKHSYNLRHFGLFSANAHEALEATVDFLPFFAAGVVASLLPVSLANAALAIGLLGNAILIFAAYDITRRITGSFFAAVIAALMMSILPPVVYVGGTGFMATLFAGLLLLAFDWIVVRRGRWAFRGFILLGVLPLVRLEAVLPGAVIFAGSALQLLAGGLRPWSPPRYLYRGAYILAARLLVLLAPIAVLSLWRYYVFGSITPLPVAYKNTGIEVEYLRGGIRQLVELLTFHRFDLILLISGPIVVWIVLRLGLRAVMFVGAMIALCLAYYTGGGDWFSETWARYPLPLMCLFLVLIVSGIYRASARLMRRPIPLFVMGLAVVCAVAPFWPGKNIYLHGWSDFGGSWSRWGRIDALAAFGAFLKQTTPDTARIGSAEMATIMYFAERDLVDLLGIANPDVARAPLDPAFKAADILHKKRNPETILRRKPDVIALYEMAFYIYPTVDRTNVAAITDFIYKHAFQPIMVDIAFYRAGDMRFLAQQGFKPIIVLDETYAFVYWVGASVAAEHARRLAASGYRPMGTSNLDYRVSPTFAQRFSAFPTGADAK